jgi:MFS family permease
MAGHWQRRLGIARRTFSRYAAVWRLRACRAFLIAQFISILGSSAFRVAVAWYSIATLHSPVALGWVLAASSLPQLLLGPAAGILGDKLGRKRVVVASDITSGACYLAFFGLASAQVLKMPELLGLAVIAGVSSATFIPNASALIPAIVGQGHVSEANAARMITTQIASVLGPALAGALIPLTGVPVIFLANGASFLVSALVFGRTRVSAVPIQRRGGRRGEGSGREAQPRFPAAGILRDRAIRAGVLLGAAGNLFLVAPVAVFVPALVSASHHGAASLGGFMASQAAGLVLGALVAPSLTRDARPDMRIAFAGIAAGAGCLYVLPYALVNGYTLILAGLAMGAALAVFEVHWESYLQRNVDNSMLGQACAIDAWASFTGRTAGLTAAGWVLRIETPARGLQLAVFAFSAAAVPAAVSFLAQYRKRPRRIRSAARCSGQDNESQVMSERDSRR